VNTGTRVGPTRSPCPSDGDGVVPGGSIRSACAVGAAGALALAVLGALVRHEPTPRGDDLIYEKIAQHPFGVHTFPFGYRVGLPLIVHVLPFEYTISFVALAWLAAGGAAAFAYLLLRYLGSARAVAATLAILMCVSPPFLLVVIRQGRNTDIATVMFLMAGSYFMVRRSYWWLGVTVLVGTPVREAVLFLLPFAYAYWAERPFDLPAAKRTLAVGAPAVAVYLGLRLGVHTVGETRVPGYGGSIIGDRLMMIRKGLRQSSQEARRLFTIYGPLWLVSPVALREMRFARRGLVLVALSVVSMTFAADWGRMILLSAPVFYSAAGYVLTRKRRWRGPVFVGLGALAVAYAVYMAVHGVDSGITNAAPPPYPVR